MKAKIQKALKFFVFERTDGKKNSYELYNRITSISPAAMASRTLHRRAKNIRRTRHNRDMSNSSKRRVRVNSGLVGWGRAGSTVVIVVFYLHKGVWKIQESIISIQFFNWSVQNIELSSQPVLFMCGRKKVIIELSRTWSKSSESSIFSCVFQCYSATRCPADLTEYRMSCFPWWTAEIKIEIKLWQNLLVTFNSLGSVFA